MGIVVVKDMIWHDTYPFRSHQDSWIEKKLVRWGLIFTHLARESLHLWPSESERFSPRFRVPSCWRRPMVSLRLQRATASTSTMLGTLRARLPWRCFPAIFNLWKNCSTKKGMVVINFQKRVMSAQRCRKRMAKNGVHFMAQCQVIADYKELVGTCADIPQSLELSCIIWRHRAAWQYTNLVTQMVPKPSPLRCGMFWIEPSQFEEFGRKGRSRNRT